MTKDLSDFSKIQSELAAALTLVEGYQKQQTQHAQPKQDGGLVISEADSLLERCQKVVDSTNQIKKPKLRVLHHLACSGGTLISKCIGALPNVYVLSEVNPASLNHMGGDRPKFLPSDITTLSRYADIPNIQELADTLFKQNILTTNRHVIEHGGVLVLRDHTHSDYCVGSGYVEESKVVTTLADDFEIIRLATIRHPVDAYLSLVKNNWEQHIPKGFEEYCNRVLKFTSRFYARDILKYEDIVRNPVKNIKKIAKKLDLPFTDSFIDTFSLMKVTGDSGRSGSIITKRPRRPLNDEQITAIRSSKSFRKLAKKFNYSIPEEVE